MKPFQISSSLQLRASSMQVTINANNQLKVSKILYAMACPTIPTAIPTPMPYSAAAHPVGAAFALPPTTNVPAVIFAAPPKVEHWVNARPWHASVLKLEHIDSAEDTGIAPCCVTPPFGPEIVTAMPPPSNTPVHFADSNWQLEKDSVHCAASS